MAAIAIVAAWNFSRNQNEIVLADLALENVEALASGEGSSRGTLYGNSSGTRFCCCPGSNSCGAASCSGC